MRYDKNVSTLASTQQKQRMPTTVSILIHKLTFNVNDLTCRLDLKLRFSLRLNGQTALRDRFIEHLEKKRHEGFPKHTHAIFEPKSKRHWYFVARVETSEPACRGAWARREGCASQPQHATDTTTVSALRRQPTIDVNNPARSLDPELRFSLRLKGQTALQDGFTKNTSSRKSSERTASVRTPFLFRFLCISLEPKCVKQHRIKLWVRFEYWHSFLRKSPAHKRSLFQLN